MKRCDDLNCSLCYNADGLFLSDGGHVLPPEIAALPVEEEELEPEPVEV